MGLRLGLMLLFLLINASASAQQPAVALQPVVEGLNQPIGISQAGDGSGRLFIIEQGGRIRVVTAEGNLQPTPWLDLGTATGSGLTTASGERGLLGLAFHPEFSENGFFFVNYTSLGSSFSTVIARYRVNMNDPTTADPDSEVRLLEIPQPFSNHNGGGLRFGPDGMLYIGMGDGGSSGDPLSAGQDRSTLLGKILRIDIDSSGGSDQACGTATAYGIPADNPWLEEAETCSEIWAVGARNPYRLSFDRANGDLWIGDVGQNRFEEINRLNPGQAGANLGWDCREAASDFQSPSPLCESLDPDSLIDPVIAYAHELPGAPCHSVTGGFVYRGPDPVLRGTYIAGEFCTGDLLVASGSGDAWTFGFQEGRESFSLGGFGEDTNGRLYVVDRASGSLLLIRSSGLVFNSGFED